MKVFGLDGTESESSLPESLAQCHEKRDEFVFFQKGCSFLVLVQRACQNARAEKRQRDELCHRRCQKSVPSCVPDPEETAPQRPLPSTAKMTKENRKMARLRTCGGSQPTK